tara:strand:- start:161 stop:835 length:675 start_codon:yes stop_codon:yes gene_type:complete
MIKKELKKRLITSIILVILLFLMYRFNYILIISLIIISIISWIEFNNLIIKVVNKKKFLYLITRFLLKAVSLLYIIFVGTIIINTRLNANITEIFVFYSLLVSVCTDIGGLVFGKIFKGTKLIKSISPNKTIAGSIGSFLFSLLLVPLFTSHFINIPVVSLFFITLLISLISQIGDLFISFLKRKAKVKDTGNLLPGHGGFLDRIDGIIFSIPSGFLLFSYFNL